MVVTVVKNAIMRWSSAREDGQGMVEYALIIALVSIVVVASLVMIGGQITTTFQTLIDRLANPTS